MENRFNGFQGLDQGSDSVRERYLVSDPVTVLFGRL